MSRGPGRRQRLVLAALAAVGDIAYVTVTDVGLRAVDRSMTRAEYRALNRAAWLLRGRGRLHVGKLTGTDYRGRLAARLVVWTCRNCSLRLTSEHIPALPCLYCKTPTVRRAEPVKPRETPGRAYY